MEDFQYGINMKWKKFASIKYRKIVFHSISYHALLVSRESKEQLIELPSSYTALRFTEVAGFIAVCNYNICTQNIEQKFGGRGVT